MDGDVAMLGLRKSGTFPESDLGLLRAARPAKARGAAADGDVSADAWICDHAALAVRA